MKLTSIWIALLAFLVSASDGLAISYPTREVSGNRAPYVASVRIVDEPGNWDVSDQITDGVCTAVFFSREYALTAAHCIEDVVPEQIYLGIGASRTELAYCPVLAFDDHPRYLKKRISVNDIAVLRVLPTCYQGQTAMLPVTSNEPRTSLWLYGWGLNQNSEEPSRLGSLRASDFSSSGAAFFGDQFKPATQIAAGAIFRAEGLFGGACRGDSGAPLVSLQGRRALVVGVVSWGTFWRNTCLLMSPTVFSRVSYYHKWINSTRRPLVADTRDRWFSYVNSGGDGIPQDGYSLTGGAVETSSSTTRITWWYEATAVPTGPIDFKADIDADFDGTPDLTARASGVTDSSGATICEATYDETGMEPSGAQPYLSYRVVSFPTKCFRRGSWADIYVALEAGGSLEAAQVAAVVFPPVS